MQPRSHPSYFWKFIIVLFICWVILIIHQAPSYESLSTSLVNLNSQLAQIPIQNIQPAIFEEIVFRPEDELDQTGTSFEPSKPPSVNFEEGDPKQSVYDSPPTKFNSVDDSYSVQINKLWEKAKDTHRKILSRQSKTLSEARREYRRRYDIPPPRGYDEWYAYATGHNSPLIDEFDDLMENLRPFRRYRESSCQFDHKDDVLPAMLRVCIDNHTIDIGNPSLYDNKQIGIPFKDFTSDFLLALPDMCFYINTFDEPRNIIALKNRTETYSEAHCEQHQFQAFKRQNVWQEVITPCQQPTAAGNSSLAALNIKNDGALIESWSEATDLCSFNQAPPTGLLRCPENLSVTSANRPVLSAASLSTFSDIMFPTLWRWRFDSKIGTDWAQTNDSTPWEEKSQMVGWRGSSSGGYATGDNWRYFQRHRMVSLANGISPPAPYFVESTKKLRQWLDVGFTAILGCEQKACEVMKREFPLVKLQTLSDTFKNKIVLDMDGHGLSGRFYMLLQSGSAVMKQGLVREWHDSRLLPWLHYVPLSMGMLELEGMLEYLFTDGDHVLKSIATESQEWAAKALRREDMRIYMYRLLIELGRQSF